MLTHDSLLVVRRFDKRITVFAEGKFKRDGIDLKMGSMVVKVSDSAISTKDIKTGEVSSLPYGMVVWSTGIGTRPVIMDFMKQVGQVLYFFKPYVISTFLAFLSYGSFSDQDLVADAG